MRGRLGACLVLAGAAALLLGTVTVSSAVPVAASAAPPVPAVGWPATGAAVSGPVTGGLGSPVVFPVSFDLAQVGYEQSEYFISGTATSYLPIGSLGSDGEWAVTPGSSASYTTRILVRRPTDPRRFDGTVVVEWLNVTGGVDADPDWTEAHNELIRDGFAWVGVSAQAVGANALKTEDAVRYAPLSHPGDSFSYDIFSQAGRAVRQDAPLVLNGLRPRRVLAAGESQSAGRLVTYIDAVHPVAHVYDGYLVHSRFSTGHPAIAVTATRRGRAGSVEHPCRPARTGIDLRDRDRRGAERPGGSTTRYEDVPALGGGRHLALRLLRPGHRPQRHRQRPGRRGGSGRHAGSADDHPARVHLQPAHRHRPSPLGAGRCRLLARRVGHSSACLRRPRRG